MKKSIVIIIFSVLTASLFLPGGYGYWTDVLTIKGSIEVVPTPIPVPTQMLIPITTDASVVVIPVLNGNDALPTENTQGTVEAELPISTGNADSSMPSSGDQSVSVPEAIQQDDNSTSPQPQTDVVVETEEDNKATSSDDAEQLQEEETVQQDSEEDAGEQVQNDIIMDDGQEGRDQIPSDDSGESQEQESKEPEVKAGIDEQRQSDSNDTEVDNSDAYKAVKDDEKPEEDIAADNTSEL